MILRHVSALGPRNLHKYKRNGKHYAYNGFYKGNSLEKFSVNHVKHYKRTKVYGTLARVRE